MPLRRLYGGRPRELHHRARRDFRLPRLERLRQDHDHEDADRPAGAERRRGAAVRQAAGSRRHEFALSRRLHVAVVLALYRTDGPAEPRSSRAPLPSAGREGEGAHRRTGRWFGLEDYLDQRASDMPLGIRQRLSLAVADRPPARNAHPRRTDLGRRSSGAGPVLGGVDRSFAQSRRDDFRLDPLHERGRTLRSDRADGFGTRARHRRAGALVRRAASPRSRTLSSAISKRRRDRALPRPRSSSLARKPPVPRRGRRRRPGSARAACSPIRSARALELLRDPIRLGFSLFGTRF